MGTYSISVTDRLLPAFDETQPGQTVRAVSLAELTGNQPILVLTPTLSIACLGAGGLLAASFERAGAHVVLLDGVEDRSCQRRGRPQAWLSPESLKAPEAMVEATLRTLGSHDPAACLTAFGAPAIDDQSAAATMFADRVAAVVERSGARTLLVPHTGTNERRERLLVDAARSLCSCDRELRLWRFAVPRQRLDPSNLAIDGTRCLRLLDIRRWQSSKHAALRHCDSWPTERDGFPGTSCGIPAERFWQSSIRLPWPRHGRDGWPG